MMQEVDMNERLRLAIACLAATVTLPLAVIGLADMPRFGASVPALGALIGEVGRDERETENLVAAIIFDYRGFDTMAEQFIIFSAIIGVALLFRDVRSADARDAPPVIMRGARIERSAATITSARILLPVVFLFGLYATLHAHLTPGGGFQGGAILASGLVLLYLGGSRELWTRMTPVALLDVVKALAALTYIAIGVAGLAVGGAFLENILPLGSAGSMTAGGTIPLLNIAAGVGVAAGLTLLFREYLDEVRPEGMNPEEDRR
jgi:multicomponent Na+:H+ antiporter subunit B